MSSEPVVIIKIDDDTEIRSYREEDAEEAFAVVDQNRAHLREWLPWVDSTTSAENELAFIQRSLAQLADDNGFQAGIWYKGKLAGSIGFHYIDKYDRKTEIGYWLSASMQGKGLMTKACKAMINYAFAKYRLNRIEIHCATENKRSRAIPERLGFKQDAIMRETAWLYDHFEDHVVYSMLAREWTR